MNYTNISSKFKDSHWRICNTYCQKKKKINNTTLISCEVASSPWEHMNNMEPKSIMNCRTLPYLTDF